MNSTNLLNAFHPSLQLFITAIFGCIAGYAFNMFYGIELSPFSFLVLLIGFSRLGFRLKSLDFFIFGLFFHFVSLFWISYSFEAIKMFWLGPIALLAGSAFLALTFPLSLWLARLTKTHWIITFSLLEYLRSFHGLGLPWNHLAFCAEPMYSFLPLIGTYGISFIVLCMSQIVFLNKWVSAFLIFFVSCASLQTPIEKLREIKFNDDKIRIIQPCLDIFSKWTEEKWQENKVLLLKLSTENAENIKIYIWPEASIPFCAHTYDGSLKDLVSFLSENSELVLGHPRIFDDKLKVSMSVVNKQGLVNDYYDKIILVPFGEYIPFNIPVPKMTFGTFPYSAGNFKKAGLQFKSMPFDAAPLICYETAYGWLLKNYTNARWILSITNDAWFGSSVGPYQHLHIARMRAIEYQLPVVRCANNGISAVIARNGLITKYLQLNVIGYLDCNLPA